MERNELIELLDSATAHLIETVTPFTPDDVVAPSALPGWTRAHVMCHISGNANGLRNLLLSARSGVPLRMYANPAARDADIESGITKPADVLVAELIESSRAFVVEAQMMPDAAWSELVAFSSGRGNERSVPAERYLRQRMFEMEIHHVDLGTAYTFASAPSASAIWLLTELVRRRGFTLEEAPGDEWTVTLGEGADEQSCRGSAADLNAWLARRSSGTGIVASSGTLPDLPESFGAF
jgi:maleylpyruvate isomerase